MANSKNISFWDQTVCHVPLQEAVIIKTGASIKEAVATMQQKKIGCILVGDADESIIGIATIGDVMQTFVGSTLSGDTRIDDIMSTSIKMVDYNATVTDTIDILFHTKYRHLPVLDKHKKICGILSDRNLMNYVAENMPGDVLNLPPDSNIFSTQPAGG